MKIGNDKVVSVAFLLKDGKGNIVEYRDEPISYLHGGQHEIFPQIVRGLEGKSEGDEVEITLTAREAFGEHDSSLTFTDDIQNAPPEMRYIGAKMDAENAAGEVLNFVVTSVDDEKITIDANHPLAGQNITFFLTIKAVRDATAQEKVTRVAIAT